MVRPVAALAEMQPNWTHRLIFPSKSIECLYGSEGGWEIAKQNGVLCEEGNWGWD